MAGAVTALAQNRMWVSGAFKGWALSVYEERETPCRIGVHPLAETKGSGMTTHYDFTDEEIGWLVEAEKYLVGVKPPEEIGNALVTSDLLDRTDWGLRITGLGKLILKEARDNGRAPARTTPRPG